MVNPKVTGYLDMPVYPDYPPQDIPSKAECRGYRFISMKQLCAIAKAHNGGKGGSAACNAFGGDKGDIPVQPARQAWKWNGRVTT